MNNFLVHLKYKKTSNYHWLWVPRWRGLRWTVLSICLALSLTTLTLYTTGLPFESNLAP